MTSSAPRRLRRRYRPLVVVDDDGMPDHPWQECRTDNNRTIADPACKLIG